MEVKQVILYRRDLKMRKGKIAAQVAHASLKVFFDRKLEFSNDTGREIDVTGFVLGTGSKVNMPGQRFLISPLTEEMDAWVNGQFAKIVLSVETEEDLLRAYEEANDRGIPCSLIQDAGRTEFHGVPTYTTVAIGPAMADKIDLLTGPEGLIQTKLA